MEMFRLALHPHYSGSDHPVLGSRSPGLKLCLRLRPGPLLPGLWNAAGTPGAAAPYTGPGTLGTRGPRAEHRALQLRGARGTPHPELSGHAPPRRAQSRSSHSPGLRSRWPLALPRDEDAPIGGLRDRLFFPRFLTALRRLTPDPRLRLVRLWAGRGGAGMLTDSRAS